MGFKFNPITGTLDVDTVGDAEADLATHAALTEAHGISTFGASLVDDADASAARTTLGLGTLATQNGTFSGTSSGTNTGDQTITLTGDVTGSGTGSFAATIAASSVTLAKQANVATSTVFYRKTAGTGAPEVNTLATLKTDLGLTGTNSGDQTITLTGDVTGSGTGSFAATIANDAVTYAKMQNVSATDKILGRSTAGSGDVEEIACTSFARSMLDDAAASDVRTTLGLGSFATLSSLAHSSLTSLTSGDDHTQYALLAGRAGSQTLIGSTASSGTLTLQSTSHATKGSIIFGSLSGFDETTGALGIGQFALSSTGMYVSTRSTLSGTTQRGMLVDAISSSAATTATLGVQAQVRTQAAAYTSTTGAAFQTAAASLGAGSAVTNLIGFDAQPQSAGSTLNIGFRGLVDSSATGGYNLYMSGSAPNYLAGNLGIGTTSALRTLDVRGSAQVGRTSLASTKCAIDAYWNTNPVATNEVQSAILSEIDTTNDSYTAFQAQCFAGTLRYRGSASESVSAKGARVLDASCFVYNTGTTEVAGGARFDIRNLSTGTITNLYGNWVISAANSGGGAVTNFFGLKVDSQSIATNNYGVYLNLASGTGRWNIYSAGTADNYMAGMLGIGTTAPLYKLHVSGASSPALWVESTDDSAPYITGNANRSLAARDLFSFGGAWNGNEVCRIAFRSGNDTVNKDDGYMRFMTANDSSTLTERMAITQDGLIGMGVSAPSARLHVLSTTEQLRLGYDASNYLSVTVASTGSTVFAVDGQTVLTLKSDPTLQISGRLGIGVAPVTSTGFYTNQNVTLTGANQYIYNTVGVFDSTCTTAGFGHYVDLRTQAASFTCTNLRGYFALGATAGSGSTITNFIGFDCAAQTAATNNYAFRGLIASASNAWNVYMSGTASNYFAGTVAIGTTTTSAKLSVLDTAEQFRVQYDASNYCSTTVSNAGVVTFDAVGSSPSFLFSDSVQVTSLGVGGAANSTASIATQGNTLTGTTQRSFLTQTTANESCTVEFQSLALQVRTKATTFTLPLGVGVKVIDASVGAGSTLTTQVGVDIAALTGGATNNYGIRSILATGGNNPWNLFISGTAPNYLEGTVSIGTSTTSAKLSSLATTEQLRLQYNASNYFSTTVGSTGGVTFDAVGAGAGFTFSDSITLADAKDLIVNTTTGTKIGTATTQKLGFYNATPIVQRSGAAQAAVVTTAATNVTPYGYSTAAQADAIITLVNELRAWAVAQGFIKGSA